MQTDPMPEVRRTGFLITEEAHIDLVQLRNHLHMLAQLADLTPHDPKIAPDALSWWFTRLARELDEITETAAFWTSAPKGEATH